MTSAHDVFEQLGLNQGPRRVLVVEDHLPWLTELTEILEDAGHSVIPMIGVLAMDAETVSGIGVGDVPVSAPTADVEAVWLDFYFAGGKFDGGSFLTEFRHHSQHPVIGMSSDPGANQRMMAIGATLAIRKSELRKIM